jgi:hypothetical protein
MKNGKMDHSPNTEPRVFREYVGCSGTEHLFQFPDGDLIQSHKVIENVPEDFDVRLLIPAGASKHDVLRLLERMLPFIKAAGVDPDDINIEDFI